MFKWHEKSQRAKNTEPLTLMQHGDTNHFYEYKSVAVLENKQNKIKNIKIMCNWIFRKVILTIKYKVPKNCKWNFC